MPQLPVISRSEPNLRSLPRIRILGQPQECHVDLAPRADAITKCVQRCEEQCAALSFSERVQLLQRLSLVWGISAIHHGSSSKKSTSTRKPKNQDSGGKNENTDERRGSTIVSSSKSAKSPSRRSLLESELQLEQEELAAMEAMPQWVQELNTVYSQRKEIDKFYRSKHKNGIAQATVARKGTKWNIGDRVEVIKKGSTYLGHSAIVQIPDFDARIVVRMEASGTVKSYMANEIMLLIRSPAFQRRSIRCTSGRPLMEDGDIDGWAFDVFKLQNDFRFKDIKLLAGLGLRLFQRHEFEQKLGLPPAKTLNFLHRIESLYLPVPYHNVIHAADTMRTVHYFFANTNLGKLLQPLEKFAGLFAAAVHDVSHPGFSNLYLCQTEDPLAITYNDVSPLENMHCCTAFKVAEATSILKALPQTSKSMMRKLVVAMVLETDLANHFGSLAKFEDKVSKASGSQAGQMAEMMRDNRLMIMCMCIACADIAHSAKPWHLHQQWSKRILQEFFLQGEAEKARGMPVSSLCDREKTDVWKAQIGFIDFLVLPQFRVWCEFLDAPKVSSDLLRNTEENRLKWVAMQQNGVSQDPYKDPQFLAEMHSQQHITSSRSLIAKLGTSGTDLNALKRKSSVIVSPTPVPDTVPAPLKIGVKGAPGH